jgi:hypothetical protein
MILQYHHVESGEPCSINDDITLAGHTAETSGTVEDGTSKKEFINKYRDRTEHHLIMTLR